MIVINTDIRSAINIIELVLAPIQIIINGPNATFGKEFRIVIYGSIILAIVLFHHNIVAIMKPISEANIKLIMVSYKVIYI